MENILIFGAGRSSNTLIKYLADNANEFNWKLKVVDIQVDGNENSSRISYSVLNVKDEFERDSEVKNADLVISMLPARFHKFVAQSCVKFSKNLLTASYETKELKTFEQDVIKKGLFFLNECGLDPGLDHMSAMKIIDNIKKEGHELHCFESFTDGLVAPESDNNPWNLLFRRTETIEIENYGLFEGYANRDSLNYIEKYNIQGIPTIYRGTLRRPGYCRAWDIFVQLGATDDSYFLENIENMTHREFINSFLYYHPTDSVDLKLYRAMHIDQDSEIIYKLNLKGMYIPTHKDIYEPILNELKKHGIAFYEKVNDDIPEYC